MQGKHDWLKNFRVCGRMHAHAWFTLLIRFSHTQ